MKRIGAEIKMFLISTAIKCTTTEQLDPCVL